MSVYQFEEPEKLGFDRARLDAVPRFFESYLAQQKLPGLSLLVAREGKIAHLSHQGTSGIGEGFPVDDETIFRIYSMTKPVTSIALMMLAEQGKVMLSDEITKYLPEFKELKVFDSGTAKEFTTRDPDRMVTLHDLLTHQSGFTYDFMLEHPVDALYRNNKINGARAEGYDLAGMVTALAEMPLVFSPGTAWNYSVSTDIVGRIIEVVSGQTLDVFFSEHIFEPLGMHDTSFVIPQNKLNRFMNNYSRDPLNGKIKLADSPTRTIYKPGRAFLSGGGGLLSTVRDYFTFVEMLRRGGTGANGARIIGRMTLAHMLCNRLPEGKTLTEHGRGGFTEVAYDGVGFGLGFSVVTDPSQTAAPSSLGNYSWGGLASTFFWNDPVEDMSVILMTQLMPSGSYPLRAQLQQLVYAARD